MNTGITAIITQLPRYVTGTAVVQQFDQQSKWRSRRALRSELPVVYGKGWNARHYDAAAMRTIAADKRFSETARSAASFLSSPEGAAVLERMNRRSGRTEDGRFTVKDLETENSASTSAAGDVQKNKDTLAADKLERMTKGLVDNYNRAIVSVMRQNVLKPPSSRID